MSHTLQRANPIDTTVREYSMASLLYINLHGTNPLPLPWNHEWSLMQFVRVMCSQGSCIMYSRANAESSSHKPTWSWLNGHGELIFKGGGDSWGLPAAWEQASILALGYERQFNMAVEIINNLNPLSCNIDVFMDLWDWIFTLCTF